MTRMYELAQQYKGLHELEDMDPEAISDTLEALEGDIKDKAQAIVAVRAGMDADAKAISDQIKRLTEMKKAIEGRESRLRDYLKQNMQAGGITNIKCDYFSITLAKGREVVVIDDELELPDEYVDVKTLIAPDKVAILAALKSGEEVKGARLVRSAESLRIK